MPNPRDTSFLNRLGLRTRAFLNSRKLIKLATIFETDKWGPHSYARHYDHHFASIRKRPLTVLEIGVGGYDNPNAGGESLRVWKWFFPNSQIVGIDHHPKTAIEEARIRTFQGSQADASFLERVVSEIGRPDIIIDDGSHLNAHVIAAFQALFPLLKDDGIYVVEDLQTSYWPSFGGVTHPAPDTPTTMNFFRGLIDGLNHSEYLDPGYEPTVYDRHMVSMHFYHNLMFIYKGLNNEGSNLVRDGRCPLEDIPRSSSST